MASSERDHTLDIVSLILIGILLTMLANALMPPLEPDTAAYDDTEPAAQVYRPD